MNILVIFTGLVAVVTAVRYPPSPAQAPPQDTYRGRFMGKCTQDGIYYNDLMSFVLCSGGAPHHQYCAPGTKNAPFEEFDKGPWRDFCGQFSRPGYASAPAPSYPPQSPPSYPQPPPSPPRYPQPPPSQPSYPQPPSSPPRYPQPAPRYPSPPAQSYPQPMPQAYPPPSPPSYSQAMPQPHPPPSPPSYAPPPPAYPPPSPSSYPPQTNSYPQPAPQNSYQGRFTGHCGQDGIYYNDQRTFVLCVGRAPNRIPCAPGTMSRPFSQFNPPEFCSVNLVDNLLVRHPAGYGAPAPAYPPRPQPQPYPQPPSYPPRPH